MSVAAIDRIETGPWAANCYLVSSGLDAVVIDPGGEAQQIAEHVASNRLRVHAVLATHGHHDHVGALAEVVEAHGVPFGIHSSESRALSRVNLCRFAFHRLGPVDIPAAGIDLATVPALRYGDLEIGVVHTPGHTPGGVCFEVAGALFTGDTLTATGPGRADLPESDQVALEASAQRLAREYPSDTVIHPGHGEPGRLGDAVASVAFESHA